MFKCYYLSLCYWAGILGLTHRDPSTSRIPFSRKPAGFDLLHSWPESTGHCCTFQQISFFLGSLPQSYPFWACYYMVRLLECKQEIILNDNTGERYSVCNDRGGICGQARWWQCRVPQGSIARAGSRGFRELLWASMCLLLPSSGEISQQRSSSCRPCNCEHLFIWGCLERTRILPKGISWCSLSDPVPAFPWLSRKDDGTVKFVCLFCRRVIHNSLRYPKGQI